MRHCACALPSRISRQLGIGVKGDYILHVRKNLNIADDEREAISRAAAQQRIQIRKLPSLAFVTDPTALAGIPSARPMKKKERIAFGSRVLLVQLVDAILGKPQQRLIFRKCFIERISKIRQQAEVEILVPIGQEADF